MRMDPRPIVLGLAATLSAACSEPGMRDRMTDAIGTLSRVQASPQPVDGWFVENARGIAIVDETQAGLVISGAGGRGLLLRRNGNSWSAPCVIKVEGFGVGLTLGGEGRSLVITFQSDAALDRFIADGSYFLAQAQGTFGDAYGRTSDPVQDKDQVHVWAVAGGLYATAALGSIGFHMDHEANQAAYGKDVTEWDILDGKVQQPAGQSALVARLDRIVRTSEDARLESPRNEDAAASKAPAAVQEE